MKHLNIQKHNGRYDSPTYVSRKLFYGKSEMADRWVMYPLLLGQGIIMQLYYNVNSYDFNKQYI
jgi:hypothetical protein